MASSRSPLPYIGNKACIADFILAVMPPHDKYLEACAGSAEILMQKKPARIEIINDYSGDVADFWRVLQSNENLVWLLGRIALSINSEKLFKENRQLLINTPNILDDLKESDLTIRNATKEQIERAAAFFENQVYSFSSTGQTFGIDIRDIVERVPLITAASARLRHVCILHRDYKDAILYAAADGTVILIDPPYKGTEGMYPKGAFNAGEHENLFWFLYEKVHLEFNGKCKFIITYNDCQFIRNLAKKYGFHTMTRDRKHNMRQRVEAGDMYHELIIANYDMAKQAEENHLLHLLETSQMSFFGENI